MRVKGQIPLMIQAATLSCTKRLFIYNQTLATLQLCFSIELYQIVYRGNRFLFYNRSLMKPLVKHALVFV